MLMDDRTKEEHINYKQDGAKDRALWDTLRDWSRVSFVVANSILSVSEVRSEPG